MSIYKGKTEVTSLGLTNEARLMLETASKLSGINKSDIVEALIRESFNLGTVFGLARTKTLYPDKGKTISVKLTKTARSFLNGQVVSMSDFVEWLIRNGLK